MELVGYFDNMKTANETIEVLKDLGYIAYLDLKSNFPDLNMNINQAGTETAPSLSNLVLGSGSELVEDSSKAPLLAASPMVSGMGSMEEIAEINCRVVVKIDAEDKSEAEHILKEMGGRLENPMAHER